ncbi:MAG: endopeptidase La [Candidatus Latescibacterota bacterium]|jgi:ATP-dependent Lon protease
MEEGRGRTEPRLPPRIAVLPLRNLVLFPATSTRLLVGRPGSLQLVHEALQGDRLIGVAAQRDPDEEDPGPEGVHEIGVVASIHEVVRLPNEHLQIVVRGMARVRYHEVRREGSCLVAAVELLPEAGELTQRDLALGQNLSAQFRRLVSLSPSLADDLQATAAAFEKTPLQLGDLVASALEVPVVEKQELLQEVSLQRRLERLTLLLNRELAIVEMGQKIQNQVQQEVGQAQREHFLREQMRVIQKELGEDSDREVTELRQRLEAARLPEEARREAEGELVRLGRMPPGAAEHTVARTYLDWMVALPWRRSSAGRIDVARAARVLADDHDGLEKVKERILEYIAVRKLRRDSRGPLFCFVGPPGVGKSSLGRSIARALGRRFVRISLGGVHDEAEIRGHRRTYVGALPGRIIQGLRQAGTNNPVFMLDELDKVGTGFRGDPAAALLEVLDPEQNATFVDHYLGVPFDLSKVTFIATANQLETIPPALRDRLEVIPLSGYTEDEKVAIAAHHLLPRQLREHGLNRRQVRVDEGTLRTLVRGYTQEAGVRNLERELGRICRKAARRVVEGRRAGFTVTAADLVEYLGRERVMLMVPDEVNAPGIAAGLAWTPFGGEVMLVEVSLMKGSGGLTLTGKLGEVMKESAQIALSYLRAHAESWRIPRGALTRHEFHVHLPSGAVPKDGPSAGVTVATALLSALTGRSVRADLAMTGEITLRGRVLPVGGVKEKVLAAHRAGVRRIVLPRRNEKDLDDLPAGIREALRFVLVDELSEVFAACFADGTARRAA